MSGLKITHLFFDSDKVIQSVDKATRSVLSRFGAFVRRTAKGSIRKRKKASPPGQPPSSHTGLLKRFIFFSYDSGPNSVVIGPERLNQKNTSAPHTLEYGGTTTLASQNEKRRIHIQPRSYMGPAFEKEKQKLPSLWKNSVQ